MDTHPSYVGVCIDKPNLEQSSMFKIEETTTLKGLLLKERIFFPSRVAPMRIKIILKGNKLRNCQNLTTPICPSFNPYCAKKKMHLKKSSEEVI